MKKTRILALRDERRRKIGARLSPGDSHDRLLAEGSISIRLIRRKLIRDGS
ncbi:hypothetical protein JXD38_09890 [candidate division WOR-3 bacterium]|nr:hypothetical protein [candidate division WOR-3 bacterium]